MSLSHETNFDIAAEIREVNARYFAPEYQRKLCLEMLNQQIDSLQRHRNELIEIRNRLLRSA